MIKGTIFNLKNEKYENHIFFQMMLLVTIPLVIMGILTYSVYYAGEVRQKRQQLEAYGEAICRDYENLLSSIKEYYVDAVGSDQWQWLASQETPPYSFPIQTVRAQELLHGNSFMAQYIRNYNFINVEKGWVLNSYGMFLYQDARNRVDADAFLEEQRDNPLSISWVNNWQVLSPYGTAKESRVIDVSQELLVIKEQRPNGEITRLLAVQLEPSQIRNISRRGMEQDFDAVVFLDGAPVFQSSQGFLRAYEQVYGKNTGGAQEEIGQQAYESSIRAARYDISVSQDSGNRLKVAVGYNRSQASREGAFFLWFSLAFAAGILILIGAIRWLALKFSAPVVQLKELVDQKNLELKELFVSNLIKGKGDLSGAKIDEFLKNMEIEPWPLYRMMVLVLKTEEETSAERLKRVLEGLRETIEDQVFAAPVLRNQELILVVGEKEDIPLENKTALLYKEIKDFVWETEHVFVAVGISRTMNRPESMKRAYAECSEALHSRLNQTREHSSLMVYDDYSLRARSRDVYDIVVEGELVNAVESGNQEEAGRLLDLIVERFLVREVSGMDWNICVVRLMTAILAVPQNMGIPLDQIFDMEKHGDLIQSAQIYDPKKLAVYMKQEVIAPLTKAISKEQDGEEMEVSRQVMDLIKESRGGISLNECAQRLCYHPNHIGKLLKRDTGKTFSELVNEERMELAKYMLLTTDYSVAEIAERLQYNNVQNFIRFFKNNAQITPAAFRKAHK